MKICVLQPSYEGSEVAHGAYDPPRDLSRFLPEHEVVHVFLEKATVYRQLQRLKKAGFDIFVNLCEGYLDWDIPSIDVIHALTALDLPFTGATAALYDPSVELMKLVAHYAEVATPRHAILRDPADALSETHSLRFPLFVKPNNGGDSRGVDLASLCPTPDALRAKVGVLLEEFDAVVVEEYVDGREFSVLLAADPDAPRVPLALRPIEFVFPEGTLFKTYDLKTKEYHPDRNLPLEDGPLLDALTDAARRVFLTFNGVGPCRMDFRIGADGSPNLLDVNFAFSIFYPEGHYATADYILQHTPMSAADFLRHLIREGLARFAASRPTFTVHGDGIEGYGIRAARDFKAGDVLFPGQARKHRLVTRSHALSTWPPQELGWLRQYGVPLSPEVFIMWDDSPAAWAPQNHSCEANTGYVGLDVVALRDMAKGEELTLDYASFMGSDMEPFDCRCGAASCRRVIRGAAGNTIEAREATMGKLST
jgi:D-alanine-D-alanine ligase-like ATP-grasp enzyme